MHILFATALFVSALHPAVAADGEHFTATASIKSPQITQSAQVGFQINRFVSAADREKFLAIVKKHDTAATLAALTAMPDIGVIETPKAKTPIKYAYATPTGSGRLITIVTAKPILHIGGDLPDAKPKTGFDLALVFLILDATDKGDGEFAPAAKVKVDASGAIVTEDYGPATVHLTGVSKTK